MQESIKKLGFVPDLFLIHSPYVVTDLKKSWQVLEEMKSAGELKEIGVSNFRSQDLEVILDGAKFKPAVNQVSDVDMHVGFEQRRIKTLDRISPIHSRTLGACFGSSSAARYSDRVLRTSYSSPSPSHWRTY